MEQRGMAQMNREHVVATVRYDAPKLKQSGIATFRVSNSRRVATLATESTSWRTATHPAVRSSCR